MSLGPGDIYIPVMGMTGSGKSHFINLCTGTSIHAVGHGLESFTRTVTVHTLHRNNATIRLLDTPGFNDTRRSDTDILSEFAFWLTQAAAANFSIAGIVYTHPITAPRLQGSAQQGLNVFKEICGRQAYAGILFLTTHWDVLVQQPSAMSQAVQRQQELEQRVFSDVLAMGGCSLGLFPANAEGALRVIDRIVRNGRRCTMKLQSELVDSRMELKNTGAGKLLLDRCEVLIQTFELRMEELKREIKDAMRERDERHAADLRREFDEIKRDVAHQTEAVNELALSIREVSMKEMKKAEEDRARLEVMMMQTQAELKRLANAPPAVKVIQVPAVCKHQQDIQRVRQVSLSSRSSSAEVVSAVAGVTGVGLAAAALCTVM